MTGWRTTSVSVVVAPISRPAAVQRAYASQLADLAQVHHHFRALDAIFEPMEHLQATRHYPAFLHGIDRSAASCRMSRRLKTLNAGVVITAIFASSCVLPAGSLIHRPSKLGSQMCAVSGSCIGRPASSDARIVSALTGARRRNFITQRVRKGVQDREAHPPPTGELADAPRAPIGVSGSGIQTAAHCIFCGTSKIVGGLV